MATVVLHQPSGNRYVLLGTGYGMFHSQRPGVILGNLAPSSEAGSQSLVAVASASGQVGWLLSTEVTVVSVDGQTPAEILGFDAGP